MSSNYANNLIHETLTEIKLQMILGSIGMFSGSINEDTSYVMSISKYDKLTLAVTFTEPELGTVAEILYEGEDNFHNFMYYNLPHFNQLVSYSQIN